MCTQTALYMHENSCTVLIENKIENYLLPAHTHHPYPKSLQPYYIYSILSLSHLHLKFKVCLINLSQSDIQTLYGLQIDNYIWQCVNSSWTGFFYNKFVVHGQYSRFAASLFISIYQKWWHCYAYSLTDIASSYKK